MRPEIWSKKRGMAVCEDLTEDFEEVHLDRKKCLHSNPEGVYEVCEKYVTSVIYEGKPQGALRELFDGKGVFPLCKKYKTLSIFGEIPFPFRGCTHLSPKHRISHYSKRAGCTAFPEVRRVAIDRGEDDRSLDRKVECVVADRSETLALDEELPKMTDGKDNSKVVYVPSFSPVDSVWPTTTPRGWFMATSFYTTKKKKFFGSDKCRTSSSAYYEPHEFIPLTSERVSDLSVRGDAVLEVVCIFDCEVCGGNVMVSLDGECGEDITISGGEKVWYLPSQSSMLRNIADLCTTLLGAENTSSAIITFSSRWEVKRGGMSSLSTSLTFQCAHGVGRERVTGIILKTPTNMMMVATQESGKMTSTSIQNTASSTNAFCRGTTNF